MSTPHPKWHKIQSALSQCLGRKPMGAGSTHKGKNTFFLLVILIIFSAFLRFYNLNWGAPFYFHPDERNIASSVSQLKFPGQMNPHFFAYGSLPIYTIYFTGLIINLLTNFSFLNSQLSIPTVSFEQAILISRFFSAFFSLALIPLLFFIGKKLKDERTGLITAFLAAVSVGLIQFAHFGTFEMWLTFFSLLLFMLCLKIIESEEVFLTILLGLVFGILVATKVSHFVLLPLPILAFLLQRTQGLFERPKIPVIARPQRSEAACERSETGACFLDSDEAISLNHGIAALPLVARNDKKKSEFRYSNLIKNILLFIAIALLVFFITNPFVLLDESSFLGSLRYESGVALGTTGVFYTNEFVSTIPVVFQFLHVYPFIVNPLLTALFIPSFFYILFISIKYKHLPFMLLTSCFLLLFLPQALLYAKWTRYMIPTLPFMYLIITLAFSDFLRLKFFYSSSERSESRSFKALILVFARTVNLKYLIVDFLIGINFIFGISYFITAFIQEDTRIAAKKYALQYIPPNSSILSEVYDLGITPFNDSFHSITLYNFYDLDNNSLQYTPRTLAAQLAVSDYIILPSQRILKTRLQDTRTYPNGHIFYSALLAQANGFQKIYETPCDIFCRITYMGSSIYSFEETANVFDRPTFFIFKKISNL